MTEPGDPNSFEPGLPANNSLSNNPRTPDSLEKSQFDRIIPRLLRNILMLSAFLLIPAFWRYRLFGAIGFALGCAVSYSNFRSLSQGVEGLTSRIVDHNSHEKGGRIIMRFVFRYVLVGVVAYAIFKGSAVAFRGFLWGLLVPVAALMAEALWQAYVGFRTDS
jgi:hypothetical protein